MKFAKNLWLLFFFLFPLHLNAFDLESQVQTLELKNGMIWLLVHRPQVPVFSGIVMVRAGGVDERLGKTGLAHMFEHIAFKGSKTIGTINYEKEKPILEMIAQWGREMSKESQKENPDPKKILQLKEQIHKKTEEEYVFMKKNAVWETLSRQGATDLNAFTSKDVTAFHASMPQKSFPLWAHLFSEIIFDPVLREFYQERDVVMEERRLRYDNSPRGSLFEVFIHLAYPEGPYHSSPIGQAKDLMGLTMEDAAAFHQTYYIPQNIIGVLVGAITPSEAKKVLEESFGRFKKGNPPPKPPQFAFGFQKERRAKTHFPAEETLLLGFYKPKAPAREDYVFDMILGLMCEGRTGRLYQSLVKEKKLASSIDCTASFPGSRQDNLFVVIASPLDGTSLDRLEKEIIAEFDKLKNKVDIKELEKVRLNILSDFYWNLENNLGLAEQLATAQTVTGDWRYVVQYKKIVESITPEEIQKMTIQFFKPENRVVLHRLRGKP